MNSTEIMLNKTNYPALFTLIIMLFWGFIAAGNSIFIPFVVSFFVDHFQSQLVDFAFYTAYYIGALVIFMFSNFKGRDIVSSWGYKKVLSMDYCFLP